MADIINSVIDWIGKVPKGVGTVLDLAGRPSKALAGAIGTSGGIKPRLGAVKDALVEGKDTDFDWLLGELGADKSLTRTAAGLALDIGLDPLGAVGSVNRAAKVVPNLRKYGLDAMRSNPVTKGVLKGFSKYEHLPEGYREGKRILDSELSHLPHTVAERALKIFEDAGGQAVTLEDRIAAGKALEKGLDGLPQDEAFERIRALTQGSKQYLDELYDVEKQSGVMGPDKIEGYFPYKYRQRPLDPDDTTSILKANINAKNPHAKQRVLESYEDFIKTGEASGAEPITDVIESLISRGTAGGRSAATARFLKKLTSDSRVALKADDPLAASWAALKPGKMTDMPIGEEIAQFRFQPEVAADLNKLFAFEPTNPALETYRKGLQGWKNFATIYRPGHHMTNLKGNFWNMAIGDVKNPFGAFNEGRKTKNALKAGEQLPDIDGVSGAQLGDYLKKHGIIGGAVHSMRDIAKPEGQKLVKELLAPETGGLLKSYKEEMKKLGGNIEDSSKIGLMLDYIKRNPNKLQGEELLDEALLHNKRYLFDYNELTPLEQQIKNFVIPFYTFSKKNIPIQLEGLINHPRLFSGVEHVRDASTDATKQITGKKVKEDFIPNWLQEQGGFQIPFQDATKWFLNPYLPMQDLNLLNPFDIEGGAKDLVARINPIPKAIGELFANQYAFSGQRIHDPRLRLGDTPVGQFTEKYLGGINNKIPKGIRQLPGGDVLEYITRMIPQSGTAGKVVGGDAKEFLPALINWATGAGFTGFTPEELTKWEAAEQKREKARATTLRKARQLK